MQVVLQAQRPSVTGDTTVLFDQSASQSANAERQTDTQIISADQLDKQAPVCAICVSEVLLAIGCADGKACEFVLDRIVLCTHEH